MKRVTSASVQPMFNARSLITQGWMKTDCVARYLGTTPSNVRNMVYRGQLNPCKFSGRWWFKKEEIDRSITAERHFNGY